MAHEKAGVGDLCLHGGCFDVYGSCISEARYGICQCSQQPITIRAGSRTMSGVCYINDTMAIFYSQSDNPDLTMRVNCIGRVTSDLAVSQELGDSVEVTFELKNK